MYRNLDLTVSPPMQRIAVLAVAVALGACSGDLSAQAQGAAPATVPLAQAAAPAVTPPVSDPAVHVLPDFTQLVERYGPAVVNVEVVEKARPSERRAAGTVAR